jgi:CRISPR-associated protein Cas2
MRYIVSYDISDNKLRSRVVKVCEAYGQRVQKSVFEFDIDKDQLTELVGELDKARVGNKTRDSDSVRVYPLCAECSENVVVLGNRPDIYTEKVVAVIG